MTTRTNRNEKTGKELFLERAAAYYDDMKAAAEHAPYGQIFHHAEAFAIKEGRELVRQSLETMLQEQIDDIEKKKKRRSVRNAKRKKGTEVIATKRSNQPPDP